MTSTLRSLSRIASASAVSGFAPRASSTLTGSGGSCFTLDRGLTRTWPLTSGANPLTTSRTAEGKTFTPRTINMSSVPRQRIRGPVRPHGHGLVLTSMWSRVRKQVLCGSMLQVGQDELALRAVLHVQRGARLRVDQLGVDEPASAQVHAVLLLALAPERDADVADAHRLGDLRPIRPRAGRAKRGLSPTRLAATSTRSTLDPEVEALGEVRRVGRGHDDGLRPELPRSRAPGARCCRSRPGCA